MEHLLLAYGQVCSIDLLQIAYADASDRYPPIAHAHAGLTGAQKARFLEALAHDLASHAYHAIRKQPGDERSNWDTDRIRDRVVQSAWKLALNSQANLERSEPHEPEQAVQWIARAAESGASRIYAERLELGSTSIESQLSGQPANSEPGCRAALKCLQEMLVAYPGVLQERSIARVCFDYVLRSIDSMLEQASLVGKRDAHAPVKCIRFADYLIVQTDPDPQYDWVIPGVQHRLRLELAKIKATVDPSRTQIVDLGRGQKLNVGEFELCASGGNGKPLRVAYTKINRPQPDLTIAAEAIDEKKPAVPRRNKSSKKVANETVGDGVALPRWFSAPARILLAIRERLPRLDGTRASAHVQSFARVFRRHRNLLVIGSCLIVVAAFGGAYVVSSPRGKAAESFHRDFGSGTAGPPLAPLGPVRLEYQTLDAGGLRITLPEMRYQYGPVGVRTMFGARGDFEISFRYELLKAERPASGWGTGVFLSLEKSSSPPDSARIGRVHDAEDKQVFKWDHASPDHLEADQAAGNQLASKRPAGRMRFVRKGPMLRYLVADGNDDNFVLVKEEDYGTGDIDSFRVAATTANQPCAVDVRLIDLEVAADQLTNLKPTARASGISWTIWLGLALIPSGLVLYATRRRRRSGPNS